MLALALTLALAAPPAAAAAPAERVRVAILGLRNDGVDGSAVAQIVDALALRMSKHARAEVLTATEIQAVLGLEATRQAMDCSSGSCAAMDELTRALDVKYIVGGSVSPRDVGMQLHVSLVDVQKATPLVRSAAEVELDDLADDVAPIADELLVGMFGAPAPSDTVLLQETSSGLPPLSWIGVAAGGFGLAMGALGGILWAVDHGTIEGKDTLFQAKEDARGRYVVDQALVGAGAGILVLGVAVTGAGLMLQE